MTKKKWSADTIRKAGEYAQNNNVRMALEPLNRFEMYVANTLANADDISTADISGDEGGTNDPPGQAASGEEVVYAGGHTSADGQTEY